MKKTIAVMTIICLFLSMFTYGCSGKNEPENTASSSEADSSSDKTQDITQNNKDDSNTGEMNEQGGYTGISDDRSEQTKVVVEMKREYKGETLICQYNKYGDSLYYEQGYNNKDIGRSFSRLGYDDLKNVYTYEGGDSYRWRHYECDADYIDSQTDKQDAFRYFIQLSANGGWEYCEVYEDGECKNKYYHEYDSNRKIIHSVDIGGEVYYQYDDSGKMIRYEKTDGSWTNYEHDATGNTIRRENSDGSWTSWEYDAAGNKIREEDSEGRWTNWEYDVAGNKIREEHSYGTWYSYEYDAAGNMIREEVSDGSWYSYEYDATGNMIRVEYSDGWCRKYDESGYTTYRDTDGTWAEFDLDGNIIYIGKADGTWTKWEYDASGNMINSEGSDGSWKKWSYDDTNNFIMYETSDGKWEHREYGREGRLTYIEGCSVDLSRGLLSAYDIFQVIIDNHQTTSQDVTKVPEPEGPEIKGYGDQFWIKIEYDDEGNMQYTDSKGYKAIAEGWQYGGEVKNGLISSEWTGWEHGKDKKECWVWNPKGELELHVSYQYYK